MRTQPIDRLAWRRDFAEVQKFYRSLTVCIPSLLSTPNFDIETQSGIDVSAGDGTGRIVESWKTLSMLCRLVQVDQYVKLYGRLAMAVEVGDLVFGVDERMKLVVEEAIHNEYSYIYVDEQTYRPADSQAGGVGFIESWLFTGKRFKPVYLCPGYPPDPTA